jgi:hypothetical protein
MARGACGGTIVMVWAFGDVPSGCAVGVSALADNHINYNNNNNNNNSNYNYA